MQPDIHLRKVELLRWLHRVVAILNMKYLYLYE